MVSQLERWNAAVDNREYDEVAAGESTASMDARLTPAGETFVDASSGRAWIFTYAGMIAHVLTYAAHRRTPVAGALVSAGTDVDDDPLIWFAPATEATGTDEAADFTLFTPPKLLEGRWLNPGETGAVVLNQAIRKNTVPDIHAGDEVQLMVAEGLAAAVGRPPRVNQLRIATTGHDERTRQAVADTVAEALTGAGIFLAITSCLAAVVPTLVLTAVLGAGFGNLFMDAPLPYRISLLAAVIWIALAVLGSALATEAAATRASRLTVREALAYF